MNKWALHHNEPIQVGDYKILKLTTKESSIDRILLQQGRFSALHSGFAFSAATALKNFVAATALKNFVVALSTSWDADMSSLFSCFLSWLLSSIVSLLLARNCSLLGISFLSVLVYQCAKSILVIFAFSLIVVWLTIPSKYGATTIFAISCFVTWSTASSWIFLPCTKYP